MNLRIKPKRLIERATTNKDKERGRQLIVAAMESGHVQAEMYFKMVVDERFIDAIKLNIASYLAMTAPLGGMHKQGRNEHCSCGSGLKYKKCCGA